MLHLPIEDIKSRFSKIHSSDEEHLRAIFSKNDRMIVEAPAGSGKTKILISKIAYNIITEQIPDNKKILALTFSVNAAYKIKKEVAQNLPILTQGSNVVPSFLNNVITVTNFHGFARKVLKKYGRLLNEKLSAIDILEGVSDNDMRQLSGYKLGISEPDLQWITDFNKKIVLNLINYRKDDEEIKKYLQYVNEFFLPNNKIPFNAYLIYLIELFTKYPQLRMFYCKVYPIIIIDEFQDTNGLSWEIIQSLISKQSKLWLFGDPLQRIYGFIGALDNLMQIAKDKFSMEQIELHTNYRFKDNPDLLGLDKNIRECAKNIAHPTPKEDALLPTYTFNTINDENIWTVNYVKEFLLNQQGNLAILIKQRSPDIALLIELLNKNAIDFFYALFTDDDIDYVNFHRKALEIFVEFLREKNPRTISKQFLDTYYNQVCRNYDKCSQTEKSLLVLLDAFLKNLQQEYKFLDRGDKISFITDVLSNRSLKQSMEYINTRIVLSTVHGAKGLEWDNVIVRGLKNYGFPSFALCGKCNKFKQTGGDCGLNLNALSKDENIVKSYIEELSVFYVASTRAKKCLFMTSNEERINTQGQSYRSELSCFLKLPGIVPDFK